MNIFINLFNNQEIFNDANRRINIVKFGFAFLILIEYLLIFQRIELVYELKWKTILFPWVIFLPLLYFIPKYKAFFSLVNWLAIALIIGAFREWEYHVDYTYISFALAMLFVDLSTGENYSKLDELFLFFVCVVYFYFDSVLFKVNSEMWANGMGLWAPVSNIVNIYNPKLWEFFGSYKFINQCLSHLTFAFEALMIFVFFIENKFLRYCIIVVGAGLHFGIFLAFPIPLFAALYVLLYVLIWPRNSKITDTPLFVVSGNQLTLKIFLKTSFIILLIFSLSTHRAHFDWHKQIYFFSKLKEYMARFTGITNHDVFIDWHFARYNHVFNIRSNNHEIPLVHEDGRVGLANFGRYWANYSFRVNRPGLTEKFFKKKTIPVMKMYINSHGIKGEEYSLYYKKIQPIYEFKENFLRDQRSKPWIKIGSFIGNDLSLEYKKDFSINSMFKED